jgi:plasmid replication initiation protein
VRKPPAGEMLYERRNGDFVLQITGHPSYGLPFGQDRIVPIYLATLAMRQQSQTIRFRTASEMLETFGMHKGGKEYRRLVAAFERIFGATIFFGTDTFRGTARVVNDRDSVSSAKRRSGTAEIRSSTRFPRNSRMSLCSAMNSIEKSSRIRFRRI